MAASTPTADVQPSDFTQPDTSCRLQTTVYRLEGKKTLRRIKKISHAHVFEASISRGQAQGRLIDDLLSLLGDRLQPIMAHLIESRKFTLQDVRDAERALLALQEHDGKEEKE